MSRGRLGRRAHHRPVRPSSSRIQARSLSAALTSPTPGLVLRHPGMASRDIAADPPVGPDARRYAVSPPGNGRFLARAPSLRDVTGDQDLVDPTAWGLIGMDQETFPRSSSAPDRHCSRDHHSFRAAARPDAECVGSTTIPTGGESPAGLGHAAGWDGGSSPTADGEKWGFSGAPARTSRAIASLTRSFAPPIGLEPITLRLTVACSAN